ncbi:hypothetical protein LCGC14_0704640 [marine sediment metagenome]|uniref:Uncharacterized protein n=1 Tax=marine sediment metagenome TaxID=412755 RepID=A0A0F9R295_9ZZZZ|nr:hypothetical protein [archaeon]
MSIFTTNEDGYRIYPCYRPHVAKTGKVTIHNYYSKYKPVDTKQRPPGRNKSDLDPDLTELIRIFRQTNSKKIAACRQFNVSIHFLNRHIRASEMSF